MNTEVSEEKLEAPRYRFDEFVLDVPDRQLWRSGTRIDLNARYLDALVLLVRERGQLVEKNQFFDEVWNDVVVSDSALTQCIKEIRKQLDDDAANPRYIQTVPRYGYRFIGSVEPLGPGHPASGHLPPEKHPPEEKASPTLAGPPSSSRHEGNRRQVARDALLEGAAGTLGGGVAGLLGGLLYGFGLASVEAGTGTLSTLLVLVSVNVLVGLTGGFGVSFGLAGASAAAHSLSKGRTGLRIAGATLGGMLVGALAKLLGVDAFNLLFGRAPAGITGGPEGAALGAALALGTCLGESFGGASHRYPVAGAGLAGAAAGVLIPLAGGHLMGGSLDLLARSFIDSRLQLDTFGSFFGELHFGLLTQVVLGGVEGLFFGSCVVGAIVAARRLGRERPASHKP